MKRRILLILTMILMAGIVAPSFATDNHVVYATQIKENDNNDGNMGNNIGNNMQRVANANNDNDTDWGWIGLAGLLGLLGLRRREERK